MTYLETKHHVENRGSPPDDFLDELIAWAKSADPTIFLPNAVPLDIYAVIRPTLGPWRETAGEPAPFLFHRRAAMCEAMRVHAGLESSWNWNQGIDTTNESSMTDPEKEETGTFQVSHNSLKLNRTGGLKEWLEGENMIPSTAQGFIDAMKSDHPLALGFYARLVRINTRWAGPLISGAVMRDVRPYAVEEFMRLLAV